MVKKVIITGAAGFIGYNLALKLQDQGINLVLIDNMHPFCGGNKYHIKNIKGQWIIKDMNDVNWSELMEDEMIIYDLAGQTSHGLSMRKPREDLKNNLTGHISLMEAARDTKKKVKIIYSSTRQIYGKAMYLPVDEKHPVKPVDINGVNKWMTEEYYRLFYRLYGIDSVVLRLTNVYGPGQHIKTASLGFTGWFINRIITNNPIEIYGEGKNKRDFLYIDDAINALLKASKIAAGETYNIGGGDTGNIYEFAKILTNIAGKGDILFKEWEDKDKLIDIGDYITNDNKFRKDTQWEPVVKLQEGIEKTIEYYRLHKEYYIE